MDAGKVYTRTALAAERPPQTACRMEGSVFSLLEEGEGQLPVKRGEGKRINLWEAIISIAKPAQRGSECWGWSVPRHSYLLTWQTRPATHRIIVNPFRNPVLGPKSKSLER